GKVHDRDYLNYLNKDKNAPILTESLMTQDLITCYFSVGNNGFLIIDTIAPIGSRPTTVTTANDLIVLVIKNIRSGFYGDKKDLKFLYITNNPFTKSQSKSTQIAADDQLHKAGL